MKLGIKYIGNALILLSMSAGFSWAAPIKSGGTDGGGGNAGVARDVSDAEIMEVISHAHDLMRPILYTLEGRLMYIDAPKAPDQATRALKKMFAGRGENNVYAVLDKLRFVPKEEGPCRDLRFEDKDGSAFNENPSEICLSVERLKKRVNSLTMVVEVGALMMHELSHRLDADEDEAQTLQEYVSETFNSVHLNSFSAAVTMWSVETDRLTLSTNFEKALNGRNMEDAMAFCSEISELAGRLDQIILQKGQESEVLGYQMERPKALQALNGARIQAKLLTGFCREIDANGYIKQGLTYYRLDVGQPASLAILGSLIDRRAVPARADGQGIVGRVMDWNAARFNYTGLQKNLNRYKQLNVRGE